ncbi:endospore germination permease [Ammoniphilus sp. YIM 78166]|uniref:GerAB/ArcD/ProY family transporter n=1 Tax=Ammoniphilus sp. YIM 78166 TaxID=1644106 RepID=UPI00196AA69D|nr:endospore germination permease [Ammoniphilus sp. YIM 78166]
MIEKGKISALQMAFMMYPLVVATGDLLIPAITGKLAERDMWLSPIWASLGGFLTVYVVYQLSRLYPKQTIIQYSQQIAGRIPGKLLGFLILFYIYYADSMILRQYGEFVVGIFLPTTPMILVIGSMTLLSAFAVGGGVEVLGRESQMFVPIVILFWILTILLTLPDMETDNMFPILAKGIMPSLLGSIPPMGWFTHFMVLAFLLPFLGEGEKGLKWANISVIAIMVTLAAINIAVLLVFGGLSAKLIYPAMSVARYISLADFLEHLESITMAIWVVGVFLKFSVYYYALALGTAQWLNLSDYRPVVFPLGFLLAASSIWMGPNLSYLASFLGTIAPFYNISSELLIPILLLLIALLRKKNQQKKGAQQA